MRKKTVLTQILEISVLDAESTGRSGGQWIGAFPGVAAVASLMTDKCAKQLGAKSAAEVTEKMKNIDFRLGTLSQNGRLFATDVGGGKIKYTGSLAEQLGNVITVNINVNWSNPSETLVKILGTDTVTYWNLGEALGEDAKSSGPLSAQEVRELILLHELKHVFTPGNAHPPDYHSAIYSDCLKGRPR